MTGAPKSFHYGLDHLSSARALDLSRNPRSGALTSDVIKQVEACRRIIHRIVEEKRIVYGINTGFGPLCTTAISRDETEKLQTNILRSHSVGMGEPVSDDIVRLMLVLKVHALAQGYSGISQDTLQRILWHLKENIIPVVPSQGSVGASGDLAPLAHLFLPLIGQGQVIYKGIMTETSHALHQEKLNPLLLGPKEGLALINGTQFMAAHGVSALERFKQCLDTADIIGAMTLEALLGSEKPFLPELHVLRPYAGSQHVAHRLKALL